MAFCVGSSDTNDSVCLQVADFSKLQRVGAGLDILECIWLDRKSDEKLKCRVMSSKSLIHIGGS